MKNKILILLSVLVCIAMVGCGKTNETTTDKKDSQQEVALDLEYFMYADGTNIHDGRKITDVEITKKIENFMTEMLKYPVEAESREDSTDLPKGGYIEIKINNGDELYKRIYIVSSGIERVHFSDKTDSEKSGYYYTDNNITSDFYNEMIDYARSQGWVG